MNRSFQTQALVLTLKTLGENNFSVTLLTPDKGILYATLYGGPKSKMRSLVSQWNFGNIWLYENPEKNQIKITDFEVQNYHNSFGQNLFKMYAASLAAELAIKTRCGGSNEKCFTLVCGFLDGMDICSEEQSRLGLIRFLWRFLKLLGILPETGSCGSCGKSFLSSEFAPIPVSYYNNVENNFICHECFKSYGESKSFIKLHNSSLEYLSAVAFLSPKDARKLSVTRENYEEMKELVFFLIENSIEQKLNSIETGVGIL